MPENPGQQSTREMQRNIARLETILQKYIDEGTQKGQRLYRAATAIALQLFQDKLQTIGALYVAGSLANVYFDVDFADVQGSLPRRCTMNNIVTDTTVNCLLWYPA